MIVRRGSGYGRATSTIARSGVRRRRGVGDFSTVDSAIQTIEGWFPGSISYRNNNPGNLRPAGQPGCTPVSTASGPFCSFSSLVAGQQALENQVALDASRGLTIAQFAAKYAPAQDANDPVSYAAKIAAATGLSVNDPLASADSSMVAATPSPASDAIAQMTTDGGDNTMLYVGAGLAAAALGIALLG